MLDFLKKVLGDSNESQIKQLQKTVDQINAFEPSIKALSDEELRAKTSEFKDRLNQGETLDDLLPEAFAVVREAAWRSVGMRHFDVQLIGGIVLHQGRIAEMRTGEGKTLVATLPAYLNALKGEGVHIVTVNDYLASRDAQWMGKIHRFLGLSVGVIIHDLSSEQRRAAYACDITYGTNNEFGFDYLRDNMVIFKKEMVQRPLSFAIVDEVDSILIDEARTPLIISGQGDKSTEMYGAADRFVKYLKLDEDYLYDEKDKAVTLTEKGVAKAEQHFKVDNLADAENTELNHHINQALKANVTMKLDVDYVVKDGEVIIVDDFTGRLMYGRRYSDGLHQAIEAKEHVKVERESKTLATITFQNYFRMYKKLSGMTGTAKTEEEEFRDIYGLDVVTIPTNKPMIRKDFNDVVYRSQKGKFEAVVREIEERHESGQPVLVGTISVEKSEELSRMLKRKGIHHQVLNAKHHDKEATIVAQAGHYGAVTIATNMAGRGTDILLGGNPEFLARLNMHQQGFSDDMVENATSHEDTEDEEILAARREYQRLYDHFKAETDVEHEKVVSAGGLHIIGTERHESRRIDNQLRGRSGRQGDPGSSRFYLSLDDDLLRLFGSERIEGLVTKLGMNDDEPIDLKMLTKQIESAQRKVEGRNYNIRKNVLQYDDVMNTQREVIYGQRRTVLEGGDVHGNIMDMLETVVKEQVEHYMGRVDDYTEWDIKGLAQVMERIFPVPGAFTFTVEEAGRLSKAEVTERCMAAAKACYAAKEEEITGKNLDMREVERVVLLKIVDQKWMDHIDAMDQMRQGIGLRAYGQRDPVIEYKMEGFDMFEEMIANIRLDTVTTICHLTSQKPMERKRVATPTREGFAAQSLAAQANRPAPEGKKPVVVGPKVGRNEPCPCGSGKKYKNCHGRPGHEQPLDEG
ncbi:preprotein translocase subunit SecA [Gehongia tenuis]|uniref:Protein translocase subunit SecA n=1 Tax=Gehongia tenuis TaxID=2763655 RepID=A0A926D7L9_9FIRM|nr:preprotein translocase subunit SecA [Gehongia tenuis]MBC8531855.1 preprotein translocase subunit SecA [Gehongia tenuis]